MQPIHRYERAPEPYMQVPQLSIVAPTFNESSNIHEVVRRLDAALAGIAWEVIFVDDDSPDGTAKVAKELACSDARVRCIRRIGRRGLSGACVEGILSSSAPTVAVIDADLQHDESILPRMFAAIHDGADLVIGSRYTAGQTMPDGFSRTRQWGSIAATDLARRFLNVSVSDPMSGFFMIRREKVEGITSRLAPEGFKLLLDIIASSPEPLRTVEIPFVFRKRLAGESKLDSLVTAEYLGLLVSKISGGVLPIRFLMFAVVGATGILIHLATLQLISRFLLTSFPVSQLLATIVAMTWNFVLNNQLTYRDRRLEGMAFVYGLATFYLVCSLGAFANVGAASWLYQFNSSLTLAGFTGAILGSVFNYAASSVVTWRR